MRSSSYGSGHRHGCRVPTLATERRRSINYSLTAPPLQAPAANRPIRRTMKARKPEPLWFKIAQLGCFVGAISLMGSVAVAFAGALIDAAGATPVLHSLVVMGSAAAVAFAGVALQDKLLGA